MLALQQPKRLEHPWVDDSFAPIYRLTYPALPSEEEVIARNAEIHAWYRDLDHRIAWVVDCSLIIRASPTIRQQQSLHLKRIEPYAKRWDICNAFVIQSAVVRGYLTAVFWFSPPPYEYQIFATNQQAMDWVCSTSSLSWAL